MASISRRTITWTDTEGRPRTAERFQARYRDRRGVEHTRKFKLKRDAQRWIDEQTAGLVTGQWVDPHAGKETLKAYGTRWLKRRVLADSTEASYAGTLTKHVYPTLGAMRLDAITPNDVQLLVKEWTHAAAPATVENRYVVLATLLRSAVRDRLLPETPCVDIKLPRVQSSGALVPIGTDVVRAMHTAIAPRYRALIIVAAGSGLRRGELCGLTHDRVSADFGTVRVDRQLLRRSIGDEVTFVPPKTEASVRTVPVGPVVTDAIAQHLKTFGQHESGLIFTSAIGTPLRTSTLWTAWRRAAEKVGTDATPHDLRHYFASVQLRGGTSVKALQAMLGHKSAVETLDTYGHLMGDEDTRSRQLLEAELTGLSANSADSTRTVATSVSRLPRSEA